MTDLYNNCEEIYPFDRHSWGSYPLTDPSAACLLLTVPTTPPPGRHECTYRITQQKQMWGQTGTSGSLYSMNKASFTVAKHRLQSGVNWNQMSDKQTPSIQVIVAPSNGNSVKYNRTGLRPGSQSPGGVGVDVKHGSYDRYLARKKSYNLRAQSTTTSIIPVKGNKKYATNAVAGSEKCVCISA